MQTTEPDNECDDECMVGHFPGELPTAGSLPILITPIMISREEPPSRLRGWRRLGLDRAILFTVLGRGWAGAAGLLTVLLIARFLSSAEQGYYYTFGSLVALQIVFELGFSFVILQLATHERAHLSIAADQGISGDPIAHARLASVIQKSVRWYSLAALLLACTLVPAGLRFFGGHEHAGPTVAWRLPWIATALAATLTFQIDPVLSFLEGCGFVADIARLRLAQAVTGSLLAWAALASHHGLFAPAMVLLGTGSASLVWLAGKRRLLLGLLRHQAGVHRIQWRKEVWPFQWRIAISWMSGYFIFQLFTPVLFAFRGPVTAGQMGMSLNVAAAIQSIAISWISTKSAPFGAMIARREFKQLDAVFFRALRQSVVICAAGALMVWLLSVYLSSAHPALARRLLGPPQLGLLLLATTANIVVFAEALYLRAHKQEKFLLTSVLTAAFVSLSTYLLGRHYGAAGIVAGYLAVVLVVSLGLGTWTFLKYRRVWHAV